MKNCTTHTAYSTYAGDRPPDFDCEACWQLRAKRVGHIQADIEREEAGHHHRQLGKRAVDTRKVEGL